MAMLLLGTVLIALSSQVKLPSLLAVGFVAMALACRWGGTVKAFFVAGFSLAAVSVAVMAVIGWVSGLGFGWRFVGRSSIPRRRRPPPRRRTPTLQRERNCRWRPHCRRSDRRGRTPAFPL
jgi:alpha-1,6-mannosyltransferase